MAVLDETFAQDFITMADDGWNQGWHERNGGNLSYRLTEGEVAAISDVLKTTPAGEWQPFGWDEPLTVPGIGGDLFLITGAGEHFRHIERAPEESIGIIEVDEAGENYRVRWGFASGAHPTTELPAHLLNHEVKKQATNGTYRVIYHAHPANITALTFVLPLDSDVFTQELMSMISECALVFPAGVGVIPWMVPGSRDIAVASADIMEERDVVIWPYHGTFSAGKDFDDAFGLMHTVEKAAEILVKVKSMLPPDASHSGIGPAELEALRRAYGL